MSWLKSSSMFSLFLLGVKAIRSYDWNVTDSWVLTCVPSDLLTNRFFFYNCSAKSTVLDMSIVLCHLGDTPMHSEITNTPNPSFLLIVKP